jgi:type IV pilus assembly protein PilB
MDDDEGLKASRVPAAIWMTTATAPAASTPAATTRRWCVRQQGAARRIKRGASDIHFEPYETAVPGALPHGRHPALVAKAPVKLHSRISARLKVMAQLDIAERRVPQDGRIKLNLSKTKRSTSRVSTCPTLFGEKVVLRILDGSAAKLGIDKLGYEDDQRKLFLDAIPSPTAWCW